MVDLWITILCSALSAVIAGFFTLIGVRMTIKHDDAKKKKEEIKKLCDERPRLEIMSFQDIKPLSTESIFDCDFALTDYTRISLEDNSLHFSYDQKIVNPNNLCCVEYSFSNTGKTEIDSVCFVCNQKDRISLVDLKEIDYFVSRSFPSCEAWSNKRFIKPGDSLTLRVCYLKGQIVMPLISAVVSIHLQDINGNLWHQPLFCPSNETDNSTRESFKQFKEYRDINSIYRHIETALCEKEKEVDKGEAKNG